MSPDFGKTYTYNKIENLNILRHLSYLNLQFCWKLKHIKTTILLYLPYKEFQLCMTMTHKEIKHKFIPLLGFHVIEWFVVL